ncbi:MAG: hypothetical protein GEU26_12605 [Nitrososphaeraceae archaeon]|nr:hypothetical protein [Nitrososphaeraceae archaeon]
MTHIIERCPNKIEDVIEYCVSIIVKEARNEERLVKQLIYTMLSAYTNNPFNLGINSPSGEGKNWVLRKVAEKFPREDITFLSHMTERALFHRKGTLVHKDASGEYIPTESKIKEINKMIAENEYERDKLDDRDQQKEINAVIEELEDKRKEILDNTKKLIELSHTILIFEDTPKMGLFEALMSLFSHDMYEVEYEYVDTSGTIKTKTNILRGWPVGIFAQAVDYSRYERWPEVQRRFIMTNPKMDSKKYAAAVDLTIDKNCLPHFVYQKIVSSDEEKDEVRNIILDIKRAILSVCDGIGMDDNPTFVPYSGILKRILSKSKTSDMTAAKRFTSFLSLLPIINIKKRPTLRIVTDEETNEVQMIPLALFDDLRETSYLMEDPTGIRPYQAEWYHEIFLVIYNSKTQPDSRPKGNIIIEELRKAVTTQELIEATKEMWGKDYNSNQLLQTFIYPLLNQGYIDSIRGEIDRRSNIYYPLVTSKYIKLLYEDEYNNFVNSKKILIENPDIFPSKTYLEFQIQGLLKYYYEKEVSITIVDHESNVIGIKELIGRYYNDTKKYFEMSEMAKLRLKSLCLLDALYPTRQEAVVNSNNNRNNTSHNNISEIPKIGISYNEITENKIDLDTYKDEDSKKLLYDDKYNNLICLDYPGKCYYCDDGGFMDKDQYERHGIRYHKNKPLYPGYADIKALGLQAQGMSWEQEPEIDVIFEEFKEN